jgi:hypothetical protein
VDELIRLATNGARSIHTVTVLDAFPYKPRGDAGIPDERCHQLVGQILRIKKPKVVLCCHTERYCDPWMERFQLPVRDYKLEQKEVEIGDGHVTIVMQSFHPSRAVNHAKYWPEYRALLMYHFVAAFAELNGLFQLPKCAEEIRKLCALKR